MGVQLRDVRALLSIWASLFTTALFAQAPAAPKFVSIAPAASVPGVVRVVTVEGEGLDQIKGVRLLLDGDAKPVAMKIVSAEKTKLMAELALLPAQRTGAYKLEYSLDGASYTASALSYGVLPANSIYFECPLEAPNQPDTADGRGEGISCSQSLLDRKEVSDIFGRRLAHMYLVVQVNVRNLRNDFDFILQDVRLTIDGNLSVASRPKELVRGVAEKGQMLDRRNLIISTITAVGTIAGGLSASLLFTADFARATTIFQGPFRTAMVNAMPDFSVRQLNRLNDHSVSSQGVVIPKAQQAMVVAFASQRIFLDQGERDEFIQRLFKDKTDRKALSKFQKRIGVMVAGSHVERVNLNAPRLDAITASTSNAGAAADLILSGANLDRIAKVRLRKGPGGATAEATIKVGENSSRATGSMVLSLPNDEYNVYLISASGEEIPTSSSFTISERLPTLAKTDTAKITKGASAVTVSFTVERADLISGFSAMQNGKTDKEVKVEGVTRADNTITASVWASARAQTGEHVWSMLTTSGKEVGTAQTVMVADAEPAPLLLTVSVNTLKAGDPEKEVVFKGERLDKVKAVAAYQNGEADAGIKVEIVKQTESEIQAKVTAAAASKVGEHRWALDKAASVQVLQITK